MGGDRGHDPRAWFAERLAELVRAAGSPKLDSVARSANALLLQSGSSRQRRYLASGKRISAWQVGDNLPNSFTVISAVVTVLIGEVSRRARSGDLTDGLLDRRYWQRWWDAAHSAQSRKVVGSRSAGSRTHIAASTLHSARIDPAFLSHFEPRARGVERAVRVGWYFTGRTEVLKEIVSWLKDPVSWGAWVVTGDPGSGKSAILARVVTFADAKYRPTIPREIIEDAPAQAIPSVGSIDAAIHASQRTIDDISVQLANAFGISVTEPRQLVDSLISLAKQLTILVDAVDEAVHPEELVRELLAPLALEGQVARIRLLIGTRKDLLPALHSARRIIDLDDERYFRNDDVETYALRYLTRSGGRYDNPYALHLETAKIVAREIARKSGRSFLVAQLITLGLILSDSPIDIDSHDWADKLPSTVDGALDTYLARLGESIHGREILGSNYGSVPACARWVRELLAPLAFAEGAGLSDDETWAKVAAALGTAPYTAHDVRLLRTGTPAGALLRSTMQPGGLRAWRLFHQALTDYIHARFEEPYGQMEAHRAYYTILREQTGLCPDGSPDWANADYYTRAHLATHAARAGELDALVVDPDFLLVAEPGRLLPELHSAREPRAQISAHVYQLCSHRLRVVTSGEETGDPRDILTVTAKLNGAGWLAELVTHRHEVAIDVIAAKWNPVSTHRKISYPGVTPLAVAFDSLDNRPVAIVGDDEGTVRVWDLNTNYEYGLPMISASREISSVCVGFVDETQIVVTGDNFDDTIEVWDLRTRQLIRQIRIGEDRCAWKVSLGLLDDRTIVACAGLDGVLRTWDLRTGQADAAPLRAHKGHVYGVALSEVAGKPVAVTCGLDGNVRIWDLRLRKQWGRALRHGSPLEALAIGELDGSPVAVTSGEDGIIKIWDLERRKQVKRITNDSETLQVALAQFGTPIIFTGDDESRIRIWDLRTGEQLGNDLVGHEESITDIAVGNLGKRAIVVSSSLDNTVRTWFVNDLNQNLTSATGNLRNVTELSAATSCRTNGRDVVILGYKENGEMEIWDPRNGSSRKLHHDPYRAVYWRLAVGDVDGDTIIVSYTGRTIQAWNLSTGDHLGQPVKSDVRTMAMLVRGSRPRVIIVGWDGNIRIWDILGNQKPLPVISAQPDQMRQVTVLAVYEFETRTLVLSGGYDNVVRFWDLDEQIQLGPDLLGHEDWVSAACIGEVDGILVGVTGDDCTIRLWDAKNYRPMDRVLIGHEARINSVAIGKLYSRTVIISGSDDETARIWNPHLGTCSIIDMGSAVVNASVLKNNRLFVAAKRGAAILKVKKAAL